MSDDIIKIPDIGGEGAEVIEICVSVGDQVTEDDSIIVLESDKASMEVPAPRAGIISKILLAVGDKVSEGDEMVAMAAESTAAEADSSPTTDTVSEIAKPQTTTQAQPSESAPQATQSKSIEQVFVPDIGAENVPVIEVCVHVGEAVEQETPLIVLESDKATMEVPSPLAGTVTAVHVKEGDSLSQGALILELETASVSSGSVRAEESTQPAAVEEPKSKPTQQAASNTAQNTTPDTKANSVELERSNRNYHAGPAVRKLAREFGVDLALVSGSGPRHRIVKEDVQAYVKSRLSATSQSSSIVSNSLGIPAMPEVDFSNWGAVDIQPLNRLRKVAAQNFQRSWLNVPHVTQFDECDITELEVFRKAQKSLAEAHGTKLTPLPFILKAVAHVMKTLPQFCASLSADGENMIYKQYIHIGVAVDTPDGLLVPVIKNVDQKSLLDIAQECIDLAGKARGKKLKPDEMQGGCFTISSLGSIGGTAFTPIVNAPEVAILGLSKANIKPVWNGSEFEPKLMLPLSLSYDHRAINGADAAKFTTLLGEVLSDIRRLLL